MNDQKYLVYDANILRSIWRSPILFLFLQIRLNVSEGLSCGFGQQVVSIDKDRSEFVVLGNAQKTVVVTPDLDRAFH